MAEPDSQREKLGWLLASFEDLLETSERQRSLARRLYGFVSALSELYAMMFAVRIRALVMVPDRSEARLGERRLPEHAVVHKAAAMLLSAVESEDSAGAVGAMEEMGILDLCPTSEGQLARMEVVAGSATGPCSVIPWVEMAVFAAELGDYRRAGRYALQARAKGAAGSCEEYDLCTVDGLIALDRGDVDEAVRCLAKSAAVCQTDARASIACGLHPLNVSLAERLLQRGERVAVLMHLAECRNVWQRLRPQLDDWIHGIENGDDPNFGASEVLRGYNSAATRLVLRFARAFDMEMGLVREARPGSVPRQSPAEVMAARARRLSEARRELEPFIIERLLEIWWRKQSEAGPG